jgi:hypothetical protein
MHAAARSPSRCNANCSIVGWFHPLLVAEAYQQEKNLYDLKRKKKNAK